MLCCESRLWCDGKMNDGMLIEEDVAAINPCGELPESEFKTTQLGRKGSVVLGSPRWLDSTIRKEVGTARLTAIEMV